MAKNNKTQNINIRFTEDDYYKLYLQAKRKGISMSELVRQKIFNQERKSVELKLKDKTEFIKNVIEIRNGVNEIKRLNNISCSNLNQIARRLNSGLSVNMKKEDFDKLNLLLQKQNIFLCELISNLDKYGI